MRDGEWFRDPGGHPFFLHLLNLRGFKSNDLELHILQGLEGKISDLRILLELGKRRTTRRKENIVLVRALRQAPGAEAQGEILRRP